MNSFDYDRVLGRTDFVFLSLIRRGGGYGLGEVVLVDPAILSLAGVKGALHDVHEVVSQVSYLVSIPRYQLPEWILAPDFLKALVEAHHKKVEGLASSQGVPAESRQYWIAEHTTQSVVGSDEFARYSGTYLTEPTSFLAGVVASASHTGPSLYAFLDRPNWFEPEVLVPSVVAPRYLLGYRSRGIWHSWERPVSRGVNERLEELVALWATT